MCRIVSLSLSLSVGLLSIATITSTILLSNSVSATGSNTDVVDQINITVPISCTLEGTGMNSHNAEILNGQYNSSIGETTLKAYCNDNEGFAIYAIGYTDNLNGKNVLTNSTLGSTHDIPTGTAISGNDSQWAMKLSTITTPQPTYPIVIAGSSDDTERESGDPDYSTFQEVPDDYTLVAKRTSGTDIGTVAEGTSLKTTYQSYISKTQPAGTYTGQVKYTLIHPHDEPTPPSSMLLTGQVVNAKMKSLAAGTDKAYNAKTTDIKAIRMANALPVNFEATEANTVSTPDSKYPIYIFFDNTNDAGIMYFYTENGTVVLNPDPSFLFSQNAALSDISGLESWDASNATTLNAAFYGNAFTNVSALADWDTSKVESLRYTFGGNTVLNNLSGLSEWDTGNVTSMYGTFYSDTSLVSLSGLDNWDMSNVQNLSVTFYRDSSLEDISALSNWNTGKATDISVLFKEATSLTDISPLANWDTGSATTLAWIFAYTSLDNATEIANWDTSDVTDMTGMFAQVKTLTAVDVSGWDTGNVASMNSMFAVGESWAGNGQLTSIIGLGDLDVSNVTDMTSMFYGAGKMTHYDIADWDVSKVQSFNHMFSDNFKLESLDLSKWDVSSLKTIWNMFNDASSLTTVGDISHWNTVNLIDAGGFLTRATAFVGDNGTLDLSGWNTTNLKAMSQMFYGTNLYNIDLSGWTFDSITSQAWEGAGEGIYYTYSTGFGTAFQNTSNLEHVYLSQSGLDSFNAAVSRGINANNMWTDSAISGFTVK